MNLIRVVTAILAGFSIPTSAANLVVTSVADAGPGSLRDTVAAALPGDEITFSVSGVIVLTSGAITIGNGISVLGPGPASKVVIHPRRHYRLDGHFSDVETLSNVEQQIDSRPQRS